MYSPNMDAELAEGDPKAEQRRAELMRDFWNNLVRQDSKLRGLIPPGMIFLPGKRLGLAGFGWAPATWMSSRDESFPYPLRVSKYPAELRVEGLLVRYPGYIIRSTRPRHIIALDQVANFYFDFSVSSGPYDWYRVEPADQDDDTGKTVQALLARIEARMEIIKLAIILSRPRPVEMPAEVGLLVEIYRTEEDRPSPASKKGKEVDRDDRAVKNSQGIGTGTGTQQINYCRIIRRLTVSRQPLYKSMATGSSENDTATTSQRDIATGLENDSATSREKGLSVLDIFNLFDGEIIGERVDEDQLWCVDGYPTTQEAESHQGGGIGETTKSAVASQAALGGAFASMLAPLQGPPPAADPGPSAPGPSTRPTKTVGVTRLPSLRWSRKQPARFFPLHQLPYKAILLPRTLARRHQAHQLGPIKAAGVARPPSLRWPRKQLSGELLPLC